jgi:Zn-dependent metalloprotease
MCRRLVEFGLQSLAAASMSRCRSHPYQEDIVPSRDPLRCILPPDLLERLARTGEEAGRNAALDTLALDRKFRVSRAEAAARRGAFAPRTVTFARVGGTPNRAIYDQQQSQNQTPGVLVRGEGQPAVADQAVNQAYDGFGATYNYYWSQYQRDSIDGQGEAIVGCVHYGTQYDNAFWDGAGHMWFGDGDNQYLTQTTAGIDVMGHELTHGVTQNEANLTYSGQSGALNEAVSDIMGIQVKQMALNQDVTQSDWLIGADIVGPALSPALRSMKDPGQANPHDQQPADMDHYIPGGDVHLNSGIPNKAFYVIATTLGGHSWDAAGPIFYATLCDQALRPNATFAQFAAITLKHAQQKYGQQSNEASGVQAGWEAVKVPLS